ncbi:MAG: VOC family protein [Actinobacteria bacterium]|nr:VOC family protein [Actinomycetota bacterium]NIS32093.1 VOC family protein [Actinomycetota bacterium]NIT96050.1 VOC family protein [Actinomycetota bacterium]NIU19734.1 VOC family protein [Actinomycetota bacterium]NIU67165.1 VOC family protein [Actinomycetota bacterium]
MTDSPDPRPAVWLGHLGPHLVPDLAAAAAAYEQTGMRVVARPEGRVHFELRGGTHLILQEGDPGETGTAPFDLMVDDLDAAHGAWAAAGLHVSEIQHGANHDSFAWTDPGGWKVMVHSSHVVGPV